MINVHIRYGVLFSLLLALLILTACKVALTGEGTEEPYIKILAGNQELQGIYYGDRNNQTREEIEKRLKMAMDGKSMEQLPYIGLNEKIIIKTENFKTEEFKIFDYILTEDGCIRYQEKLTQTSVIPVEDRIAAFTLAPNPAALLSSSSVDYEPGKTMRGFVLRADIHGSPFAFAFILRTDAHGENMFQQ